MPRLIQIGDEWINPAAVQHLAPSLADRDGTQCHLTNGAVITFFGTAPSAVAQLVNEAD